MAKKTANTAQKARNAAKAAGDNPYLRRLIEDEQLRESIRDAFDAARDAYERVSNGKAPTKALLDDKKVHRDLREAASNFREASERLQGRPPKRRRPLRTLLVLAVIGTALALVLSEDLRKAVLDKLFGEEEEFEYVSATSPAAEPVGATTNGAGD